MCLNVFFERYIESTIGTHQSGSGRTWTDIPEGAAFWVRCVYQFHHAPKAFEKMNFFIITKINLLTIVLVKEKLSRKRLLIVNLFDKNIELFIAFADNKWGKKENLNICDTFLYINRLKNCFLKEMAS